ncbi:MAG: DUF3784 domain-containing protein [Clostridium sp.]
MNDDKIILLIVTFLIGGMFSGLGAIIKTQNAGDMINGFDNGRDDKAKVSRIMGGALLYTGLLEIIVGIIGILFLEKYLKTIGIIQGIIVCGGIGIGAYRTNKYGKKE